MERRITNDCTASYPILSLDGQYLAFSSKEAGNWDIHVLQLDSDEPVNLTDRPYDDTTPVFSRDGQEIYLRTTFAGGGRWRITKMRLDRSNGRVVGISERVVKNDVGPSADWGLARPAVY